jgi:hypothetical protein
MLVIGAGVVGACVADETTRRAPASPRGESRCVTTFYRYATEKRHGSDWRAGYPPNSPAVEPGSRGSTA